MIVEHSLFPAPPDDAKIWRYMDFAKFVSLLSTQTLFFARADQLSDTWEGSMTVANVAARKRDIESIAELSPKQQEGLIRTLATTFEGMRQHTYVSCWHANERESAAMWKLYLAGNHGIAVQTTFRTLKQALKMDYDLWAGFSMWTTVPTGFPRVIHLRRTSGNEHVLHTNTKSGQ